LGKDRELQPVEQLLAEGAQHAGLRKMDVAVDETGQDEPVFDMSDFDTCVLGGQFVIRTEGFDDSVLENEEAVSLKAGGFVLFADMFPRVINEVEERSADGCFHGMLMVCLELGFFHC